MNPSSKWPMRGPNELPRYDVCVFCGETPTTREDVIPRWLVKVLRPAPGATRRVGNTFRNRTDLASKRAQPVNSIGMGKVKCVCQRCNGGWMKRLEESAKPVLQPILREVPRRLPPADQGTLAAWAMKTSLMVALQYGQLALQQGLIPVAPLRGEMFESHKPPPSSSVWMCWVQPETIRVQSLALESQPWGDPPVSLQGFIGRIILANVGFIVLCNPSKAPFYVHGPALDQSLIQIWPSPTDAHDWPPTRSITPVEFTRLVESIIRALSFGRGLAEAPSDHAFPPRVR
jgi:hypothetical protein